VTETLIETFSFYLLVWLVRRSASSQGLFSVLLAFYFLFNYWLALFAIPSIRRGGVRHTVIQLSQSPPSYFM
jgi:hypothetical protein